MVTRRSLARKTLDHQLRPEPFQQVDKKIDILGQRPEPILLRMFGIVSGHGGVAEELELVEFDGVERQSVDDRGLSDEHLVALARQPQDEMGAAVPRAAVCSMARAAAAKSCPRFTRRRVSS